MHSPKRHKQAAALTPIVSLIVDDTESPPFGDIDGFLAVNVLPRMPALRYLRQDDIARGDKSILRRAEKRRFIVLFCSDPYLVFLLYGCSSLYPLCLLFVPIIQPIIVEVIQYCPPFN